MKDELNADNFNPDDYEHPALKNYSRTGAQVKHVASKGMKWGLIGAAVGTLALGALLMTGVGAAAVLGGPLAWLATAVAGAAGVAMPTAALSLGVSALTNVAIIGGGMGAIIGGASGALSGLFGAGDAADQEEDKRVMRYEQAMMRQRRMQDLQRLRDQQVSMAYAPMQSPAEAK